MRSTLFYIPAELFGLPVFGAGLLVGAWLVISLLVLAWLVRQQGWSWDTAGYVPFLLLIAAAIVFVSPNMVEVDPATARAAGRADQRLWRDADVGDGRLSWPGRLAGAADGPRPGSDLFAGLLHVYRRHCGARLFYIVEYWPEFQQPSLADTLKSVANVTKGGLVVYGSVLAGVPAAIWFLVRRKLPVLAILDIIAPSMVVGLGIGRLGCFLNGCCYGGVCLTAPYALTFPDSSPPYMRHMELGWRSGIWLTQQEGAVVVGYVAPHGPSPQELMPGDQVKRVNGAAVQSLAEAQKRLVTAQGSYEIETADGRIVRWTAPRPPPRSVPIHPTQIYAAIDAGLLALLLWMYYPFRRRDGEVFALLLTLHPISRFVLEMIRSDEAKQFGKGLTSGLTISQCLSLGFLAAGCALWWYVERQPAGSALPPASAPVSE